MLTRLITTIKTKKTTTLIVAGLLVVGIVILVMNGNGNAVLATVTRGEIIQEVRVTGKTVPAESVELAFERTGRVTSTPVDIGSEVVVGQTLVVLDQTELRADLLKARAILAEEEAKLSDIRKSSTLSLGTAQASMVAKLVDAFAKADDAVRTRADQLFDNPQSRNTSLSVALFDSQTQAAIGLERVIIEDDLKAWKSELSTVNAGNVSSVLANQTLERLYRIQNFLDKLSLGINAVPVGTVFQNFTPATVRADLNTGRSNVNTAVTNLVTALNDLNIAKQTTAIGIDEFDAVRVQEARVAQFRASTLAIEAQLDKTVIASPINGVVTRQETKVGEIMTAGTPVVSVISGNDLEIEANVSEVNIGKVMIGNPVKLDFDAFPGQTFTGLVSYIEPAETLVDNVVNYKVTVVVEAQDEAKMLRSGLTANLSIETARRADVLRIPEYSLIRRDVKIFVSKKVGDKKFEEIEVQVGLTGSDGSTEVLSGLSEGEVVEALAE